MSMHTIAEKTVIRDAFCIVMEEMADRKLDDSASRQVAILRAILSLAKAGQRDPRQLARYAVFKCLAAGHGTPSSIRTACKPSPF
jgi:hypothetical protein